MPLNDLALATVIDKGAALADGSRAAGDYDNSTNQAETCRAYLRAQWDTTAPSALTLVGDLYVLPGDGGGGETFPVGGDGTVGADATPAAKHKVGSFQTVAPSITVDEVMCIEGIPLGGSTNRFVLRNTSGQQYDLTWQLDVVPERFESV
jgi:hypothetical protein